MGLLATADDHGQQSHAYVHAVLGLAEVGRPGVVVELFADLEDSGQGMHDNRPATGSGHQLGCHYKLAATLQSQKKNQT